MIKIWNVDHYDHVETRLDSDGKEVQAIIKCEMEKYTMAYIMYKGEKIPVTVESTFQGGTGLMANVKAVTGYPFNSQDVEAQGETFGSWACNGLRVRASFVMVERNASQSAPAILGSVGVECKNCCEGVSKHTFDYEPDSTDKCLCCNGDYTNCKNCQQEGTGNDTSDLLASIRF